MFSANINYIDLLQSWEQKDYINNQLQEDVSNQETKQNQVLLYSNPLLVTCLENLENNNWTFSSKFCHSAQQTASAFSARCSHFSCEESKESHRHYMYPTLQTNKQKKMNGKIIIGLFSVNSATVHRCSQMFSFLLQIWVPWAIISSPFRDVVMHFYSCSCPFQGLIQDQK